MCVSSSRTWGSCSIPSISAKMWREIHWKKSSSLGWFTRTMNTSFVRYTKSLCPVHCAKKTRDANTKMPVSHCDVISVPISQGELWNAFSKCTTRFGNHQSFSNLIVETSCDLGKRFLFSQATPDEAGLEQFSETQNEALLDVTHLADEELLVDLLRQLVAAHSAARRRHLEPAPGARRPHPLQGKE